MTKWWLGGCILLAALLAVFLRLDADTQHAREARAAQQHRQEIAKWKARYAEAWSSMKVQIDTVRVTSTKYRTLRDSLVITDTVQVREFVKAADNVANSCQLLADDCTRFRITADSTIGAQGNLIRVLERQKRSKWDRVGLFVGYGQQWGTNQRSLVMGIGLRIFP